MTAQKTLKFKLITTPQDRLILLKTLSAYNDACNRIAHIAFNLRRFSRNKLYSAIYHPIRSQSPLPARLICEAIRQVAWAYKDRRKRNQLLHFDGSSFHLHKTSFKLKGDTASILTIEGRLALKVASSDYHRKHLDWKQREAKVVIDFRKKEAYLCLTVEKEIQLIKPQGVIGVDIGRGNLATTSTGLNFKGKYAEHIRRHYSLLRKHLQQVGTRSARRRLKATGKRENGILRWVLHNISRRIVEEAEKKNSAIALEKLTHIRERTRVRKEQRYLAHSWAFRKLQNFTSYKALEAGIPVIWVEPEYSSQICSRCGKMGIREGKLFSCPHCDYHTFADFNASHNLRLRGQDLLSQALVGVPNSRGIIRG